MRTRLVPALLLAAYALLLIEVMVFKDIPTIRIGHFMLNMGGRETSGSANFVPFKTIKLYLVGYKNWFIADINLIGNIVLLVPVGFLAPAVYRVMNYKQALLLALGAGLTIEVLQTVLRVGIFDIDDVILNALGVLIGYGLAAVLL